MPDNLRAEPTQRSRFWPRLATAAAIFTIAAVIAFAVDEFRRQSLLAQRRIPKLSGNELESPPLVRIKAGDERNSIQTAIRPNANDPPIAILFSSNEAVWEGDGLANSVGVSLRSGWIDIKSGAVAIRFNSGAVVNLAGAAKLNLVSGNRGFLETGKLVASVPASAKGFQIHTRTIQLNGFETIFAIDALQSGDSELYIIEGAADVEYQLAATQRDVRKFTNTNWAYRFSREGSPVVVSLNEGLRNYLIPSRPEHRVGIYTFNSTGSGLRDDPISTNPSVANFAGGHDVEFGDFISKGVVPGPPEYPQNLNRWSFKEWLPDYNVDDVYVGFKVSAKAKKLVSLNRISLQLMRAGGYSEREFAPQNGVVRVSSDNFETFDEFTVIEDELATEEEILFIDIDLRKVPIAKEHEFRFMFRGPRKNRAIRLDEVTLDVDMVVPEAE